jgi:hypothetical protein
MAPMEYLGTWGTLIYEKNLKSKISCQTPFKLGQKRIWLWLSSDAISMLTMRFLTNVKVSVLL